MNIEVEVSAIDNLSIIPSKSLPLLDRALRRTALKIERETKLVAPVITGFLRNSIFTVTSEGNNESKAFGKAQQKADRDFSSFDLSLNPLEAIIAVGAEYAIEVENREEFFRPIIDNNRSFFIDECSKAILEGTR